MPPESTTTSPPTAVSTEPVGDPAALQALVEEVALNSGIPLDEFFVPDITQPDPEAALKELLLYSDWMFTTDPDKALVVVHTIDDSPAFHRQRSLLDTYESNGWANRHEPFRPTTFVQVDIERMPLTETELAELPADAVAFQFQSNGDGVEVVDTNGNVVSTTPSWSNRIIFVVIAPTDVGWQEYWYYIPEFDS